MTYKNVFRLAGRLLNPETNKGKVFISCLHRNPNVVENSKFAVFKYNLKILFSILLMIRSHSGFYPFGDDGLTKHCTPHFTEVRRYEIIVNRLTRVIPAKISARTLEDNLHNI